MSDEPIYVTQEYRALWRKLQHGQWAVDELQWVLSHETRLPWAIRQAINRKLQALSTGGEPSSPA